MSDADNGGMGQRIQILRKNRGYTGKDFARQIGISGKYLYEIESRNKWFSTKILVRITAELGVTADYILTGEGSPFIDQQFFHALGQLGPHTLAKMKQLLEIAYELAKEEK